MITSIMKSRRNVIHTPLLTTNIILYDAIREFSRQKYTSVIFVAGKSSYAGMKTGKPEFVGTIPNQSVAIGRDAVFTCNVKSLGPYKVSAR